MHHLFKRYPRQSLYKFRNADPQSAVVRWPPADSGAFPPGDAGCERSGSNEREIVSYRVVAVVAGNSDAVTLSGLKADTQYQVTVAAVWAGKKYRSRPIVFRTLGKKMSLKTFHFRFYSFLSICLVGVFDSL